VGEQAFRDAVESLSPALMRIAYAFSRDPAAAELIVREAWLATIQADDPDLRTTVFGFVVDKARVAASERGSFHLSVAEASRPAPTVSPERFRPVGEKWAGGWVAFPPVWPPELDAGRIVAAALKELPEPQRVVVSLRDEQGCSADEVCEFLALRAAEQRSLLHRGRAQLRQVVEEHVAASGRPLGVD